MAKIELALIDTDNLVITDLNTPLQERLNHHKGIGQLIRWVDASKRGEACLIALVSGWDRNFVTSLLFALGIKGINVIEHGILLYDAYTKRQERNPRLTAHDILAFGKVRGQRLDEILLQNPDLFDYPGNRVAITLEPYPYTTESVESFAGRVREALSDMEKAGVLKVYSSQIGVDILPTYQDPQGERRSIDKEAGIWALAETIGISPSKMLGIGTSDEDLPMLQLVGFVGCTQNATERIKILTRAKRGHVSRHKGALGVADVLYHYRKKRLLIPQQKPGIQKAVQALTNLVRLRS